ncbi:hypothetical protein [Lacrimispora indolis]|uniref:hypothetical protein n=1 Tax=Lacrimispora indolis TaxID=69825 RepID=UPI0004266F4F|nr:hypothetical protein [[Clostridium] methoxybenzovorans]
MEEMEPVVTQESKVEVKPEPSRWYEGYISLEDAKTFIKANIITAARSFIAIGFYLKCVRDRELFVEEDYQDVWEFAKAEYGISKSTASRYMSMNDRFSENGNSPNIREEYRAFGKSQLQEMLYLEDDQLEQVKPGDRVEDIRNLRKPKELPYIELPGQMEIEIDFPDALPLDQLQPSMISQKQTFEMSVEDMLSGGEQEGVAISQQNQEPEPEESEEQDGLEIRHFFDRSKSTGDAYGWIRSEVVKEYLRTGYKGPEREYKIAVYGDEYRVVKGEAVTVFYNCSGDDRPAAVTFDVENTRLEREYNFFFGKQEVESTQEQPEDPPQLESEYYNPDDEKKVDESYSMADFPRASDRHVNMLAQLFVQENARRLFGNGEFIRITDESIIDMLKLFQAREGSIVIDDDVEAAVCAEIIEFYRSDEDLGICLFKKFSNFARKQIDAYIDQMAEKRAEKSQGRGTFNSTPTSCPHREGYSCTVSEENRSVPGDGSNCGSSCCWICRYQGRCELECNASAGRDGEIPKYDAAWAVKTWAEMPACRGDLKKILKACRENFTNATRAKAVQNTISPYGAYSRGCGEYSLSFHSFDGGIDFRIGKVDIHLKYGRFVQELATLYPDFEIPEAVPEKPELVPQEPEASLTGPEVVQDPEETVIDGKYVEVPPEQELSARSILEEEKAELHNWVKVYQDEGLEMPPMVERQKIIVAALEALMEAQEQPESEPEPVKQGQPELPILKNNDQRAAFVDAYETWPLWIETKETGERYYRYDLPDGTSMVVKVYHAMLFDYKATGKKYEDRFCEGYGKNEYYFLQEGKFFRDCETNRSDLIEKLKELQKKGRGDK